MMNEFELYGPEGTFELPNVEEDTSKEEFLPWSNLPFYEYDKEEKGTYITVDPRDLLYGIPPSPEERKEEDLIVFGKYSEGEVAVCQAKRKDFVEADVMEIHEWDNKARSFSLRENKREEGKLPFHSPGKDVMSVMYLMETDTYFRVRTITSNSTYYYHLPEENSYQGRSKIAASTWRWSDVLLRALSEPRLREGDYIAPIIKRDELLLWKDTGNFVFKKGDRKQNLFLNFRYKYEDHHLDFILSSIPEDFYQKMTSFLKGKWDLSRRTQFEKTVKRLSDEEQKIGFEKSKERAAKDIFRLAVASHHFPLLPYLKLYGFSDIRKPDLTKSMWEKVRKETNPTRAVQLVFPNLSKKQANTLLSDGIELSTGSDLFIPFLLATLTDPNDLKRVINTYKSRTLFTNCFSNPHSEEEKHIAFLKVRRVMNALYGEGEFIRLVHNGLCHGKILSRKEVLERIEKETEKEVERLKENGEQVDGLERIKIQWEEETKIAKFEMLVKDAVFMASKIAEKTSIKELRKNFDQFSVNSMDDIHQHISSVERQLKELDVRIPFVYSEKDKELEGNGATHTFELARDKEELYTIGQNLTICVGSYGHLVKSGACRIVNVKDKERKIVACIEVCEDDIYQVKGPKNFEIKKEDGAYEDIRAWIMSRDLSLSTSDFCL